MKNLWRKIRYRRELEEIEYHRNMVAEYRGKKRTLSVDLGWYRNQDAINRCDKAIGHHHYMIEKLQAQINV